MGAEFSAFRGFIYIHCTLYAGLYVLYFEGMADEGESVSPAEGRGREASAEYPTRTQRDRSDTSRPPFALSDGEE